MNFEIQLNDIIIFPYQFTDLRILRILGHIGRPETGRRKCYVNENADGG